MLRPKSAAYLSLPCNYNSKEELLETKQKFKKTMMTNPDQIQNIYSESSNTLKIRRYQDEGPSFLYEIRNSYIDAGHKKRQQSKKLKPCKKVSRKLIENIKCSLRDISKENNRLIQYLKQNQMTCNTAKSIRNQLFKKYTFNRKSVQKQPFFKTQRLTK